MARRSQPTRPGAPGRSGPAEPSVPEGARRRGGRGPRAAAAAAGLCALFVGVALWQAEPVFQGTFIADDDSYIVQNAYVHELSWDNLRGILDPAGEPAAYTANYAPVHLLLHALEYAAFGTSNMVGWHVVNAVAHAVASLVLVLFFLRNGLPSLAALFGGAVFLTHPANAETVAWIFQLKTLVSLALALGALLLFERRPGLALALFALALLTKITALFALPVAAVQGWVRTREGHPLRWGWLVAWVGVALVVTALELHAYRVQDDPRAILHESPVVHARTMVAIAMRYLAMAYTTWGLSTFHEPPPATSWLDPWWLGGVVVLALLGWRTVVVLRRRDEEAVFWVLAAASFGPVSQLFPFMYPMGDRYLYPILPGLIGGTLLALRRPAAWLADRARAGAPSDLLRLGAAAAALVLLATLSFRSHARAPVYLNNRTMMVDSALHYPDGIQAHLLRGSRAAREGDAVASARSYQRATELGFSNLHSLLTSPVLARVRDHPAFQEMLRDHALRDVIRLERREDKSQMEWVTLGRAHWVRGELDQAVRAYERALEMEGPLRPSIRQRLRQLRQERAAGRDRERRPGQG